MQRKGMSKMQQISRELWVENHCMGLGIGKVCLLLLMLFGGVIIRDYPYSIICTLLLASFEITAVKMHGQIDYILPQTDRERKKRILIKSVLVAGLYSAVNTVSYAWLVCRREDYQWSVEIVLFLVYMTVVLFLYFFSYRTGLCCVAGSQELDMPQESHAKHKWQGDIWVSSLASLLSIFTCLFYIIFKFGYISPPMVLMRFGRGIMLVLSVIALVLSVRMAVNSVREME